MSNHAEAAAAPAAKPRSYLYKRHSLPVRVMHWLNVVALTVLLMSGLMIFNAHPSLDWGKSSYTGRPSVFEITALRTSSGQLMGVTRVFGHQFETTGVLVPTRVGRRRNREWISNDLFRVLDDFEGGLGEPQ